MFAPRIEDDRFDAVILGRAALDINTEGVAYSFTDAPSLKHYVGGSSANTAIGMARLGARVGFIGKVPDDALGRFISAKMAHERIDTEHLTACEGPSYAGLAFTEAMEEGRTNLMLYREGRVADLQLSVADISESYIASSKCLVVTGTALSQSPSREAALEAMRIARRHCVSVVFDIDYRAGSWASEEELRFYMRTAAWQADIVIGSRDELDWVVAPEELPQDDLATAEALFAHAVQVVIIKHGQEGSRAYTRTGEHYAVNIVSVDALKSTGGGDAYSSSLLFGLITGRELPEALLRATAAASIVIGAPSCSEASPTDDEVGQFIAARIPEPDTVVARIEKGNSRRA